ncbi:hypothetical protein OGAPHI_006800 [Ogataea philodendri]|uniref:DNA repair and recombination protein RAD52 n=1 Tax=Ogataea philodendri TaxID=1378263 RepID=A0A9P8NWX6_9ASCO|nr:uncharacterized protein OGAPHI_006800 [Ogataea philodendri]KAH3661393.1 hypothetical protein OGAPHI_006800 [Ogataea philodendri]
MYLVETATQRFARERHEFLGRRSLEQRCCEDAVVESEPPAPVQFFPDISGWDILEIQEWTGEVALRPASVWSVGAINTFYHLLERLSNDKQRFGNLRGFALFTNASISSLINIANRSFGFDNWSSGLVEESARVVRYKKQEFDDERETRYGIEYSIETRLMLADGTVTCKTGYGVSQFMPSKALAFSVAKKQAATDGLKACFYSLVALLEEYEQKLVDGYYL